MRLDIESLKTQKGVENLCRVCIESGIQIEISTRHEHNTHSGMAGSPAWLIEALIFQLVALSEKHNISREDLKEILDEAPSGCIDYSVSEEM